MTRVLACGGEAGYAAFMPEGRFIVVCAAIIFVILAYLLFTALHAPPNVALSFSLFAAMLLGILLFAVRIAVEDKRRHVD